MSLVVSTLPRTITDNDTIFANGQILDEIWAVDTSTNPETRTRVYKSNVKVRVSGLADTIFGPYSAGGRAWKRCLYRTSGSTVNRGLADYHWINSKPQQSEEGNLGDVANTCYYRNLTSSSINGSGGLFWNGTTYKYPLNMNVRLGQYIASQYPDGVRLIVKLTAPMYACAAEATESDYIGKTYDLNTSTGVWTRPSSVPNDLYMAGKCSINDITTTQTVLDRTCHGFDEFTITGYVGMNRKTPITYDNLGWPNNYGQAAQAAPTSSNFWSWYITGVSGDTIVGNNQRPKIGTIIYPKWITRTVEVRDVNTDALIWSNTSMLNTTAKWN